MFALLVIGFVFRRSVAPNLSPFPSANKTNK